MCGDVGENETHTHTHRQDKHSNPKTCRKRETDLDIDAQKGSKRRKIKNSRTLTSKTMSRDKSLVVQYKENSSFILEPV